MKNSFTKFKDKICKKCQKKNECEGLSLTIDGKVKCITRNIID